MFTTPVPSLHSLQRPRQRLLIASTLIPTAVSASAAMTILCIHLVCNAAPEAPDGTKWYVIHNFSSTTLAKRMLQGAQLAGMFNLLPYHEIRNLSHVLSLPSAPFSTTRRTTRSMVGLGTDDRMYSYTSIHRSLAFNPYCSKPLVVIAC